MAKTILTSEKVEKFSLQKRFALLAFFDAKIPWFSKYLLVSHCP